MRIDYNSLVIADTSCLIALANINRLEMLHSICRKVIVTPEIAGEYGEPLPLWIHIVPVKDITAQQALQNILDPGESSAIALALETRGAMLVLDEKKGRKIATQLNLALTGTLGLIVSAHKRGLISDKDTILADLREHGFRLPEGAERL